LRAIERWERVPVAAAAGPLPLLSILVPARNEEATIERCVRSLLAQQLDDFEIVAVDDRSSDRTREVLTRLAAGDARLRVVFGEPLPQGWVGKPWALHQAALRARGQWLLFTDADTYHEPIAARSTLRFAIAGGLDALTIATFQELGSFWERAVLPAIFTIILLAYGPLRAMNDRRRPDRALANGQYLMVSRAAYDALGGHQALCGEIAEDVAFARRLKRDGRFRLLFADGSHLVRVRMYRSLAQIWAGFTKNVFIGNERSAARALGSAVILGALSVAPPVCTLIAWRRDRPTAVEALCCTLSTIVTSSRMFAHMRIPRRYAVWQPLGFAVLGAITLDATFRVLSGRGVEWRGRRYPGR
jgi:chlorobactene glucosyltransferase